MQQKNTVIKKNKYKTLLGNIGATVQKARENALKIINTELTKANWEIGRQIVEFEQQGNERAEYGSELLARLSKDLTMNYGKGFGRRNLLDMRRFYIAYPKWQTVSAKLSWSHYVVLMGISGDLGYQHKTQWTTVFNISKIQFESKSQTEVAE